MIDTPTFKKIEPTHYMVGRSLRAYGSPWIVFEVSSVNGKNAYGWETHMGHATWTWHSLEDLHDVKKWNLV